MTHRNDLCLSLWFISTHTQEGTLEVECSYCEDLAYVTFRSTKEKRMKMGSNRNLALFILFTGVPFGNKKILAERRWREEIALNLPVSD